MSNPFETADMAEALPNPPSNPDKSEVKTEAQAEGTAGWGGKVKFEYELYTANTKEEREALEAAGQAPEWASKAEKYEWSDEYGDIGPEHPELEKQLFGGEFIVRTGNAFEKVKEVPVILESETHLKPIKTRPQFEDAGLHPVMLRNVKLCGYDVCTPVQAYCVPAILTGCDVFASAHTGSGKTAAFLVPILSKLMGKAKLLAAPRPNPATFDPTKDAVRAEPLVVIVTPTRELATQIFDEARRLCYRSMLRPSVVYGGVPLKEQRMDLQRGCDILIGTPGRLCDFMNQAHVLSLKRVKYTVVDEADEMLDLDWEEELKRVMHGGGNLAFECLYQPFKMLIMCADNNPDDDHVYMMFSATFPKGARELARQFLAEDHVRINVGRPGSTHDNIKQEVVYVAESEKNRALYDLLLSLPAARTMIFVNSKRICDQVDDYLYNLDLPSTSIHADRTQREREDALWGSSRAFRKGRTPLMVATGVSARGIDVKDVMHIINYDLPSTIHGGIQEYIHRIGRTARIGNTGLATSFYNEKNEDIAEMLVKTLLEAKQNVPDFLQTFIPEGFVPGQNVKLDFEDESDNSDDDKSSDKADMSTSKAANGDDVDDWGNPKTANGDHVDDWGESKDTTTDAQADVWKTTEDATSKNAEPDWGVPTPAEPAKVSASVPEKPKRAPHEENWGEPAQAKPAAVPAAVSEKPKRALAPHEENWGVSAQAKSAAVPASVPEKPKRAPHEENWVTATTDLGANKKPAQEKTVLAQNTWGANAAKSPAAPKVEAKPAAAKNDSWDIQPQRPIDPSRVNW
ncbi:MAG: hypothetical protein M1816_000820 [Peltula sp. TS41687]|nr:MAG: hypothetical protein M1816_000820 [Peltula sp. TS41687]